MHEFLDLDEGYQKLFARSFVLRPAYKAIGLAVAGLIGAVLLLFGLLALHRVLRFVAGRKQS